MIQPNSNAFSYGPFRGAFVFSLIALTAWIVLFVLTMQNCATNCYSYYSFNYPCVGGSNLYCCSLYDSSGGYYCGYYNSCLLDNTSCGGLSTGSWVAGSMLVLSIILMCIAAAKFRRLKQMALINQQNAAFNNGNQYANSNQNFGNPPVYYPNQQNPYNPNGYQQQNQGYAPPRYYPQS